MLFRITCFVFIISHSHSKRVVIPTQMQDEQLRIHHGRDIRPDEYSFVVVLIDLDFLMLRRCSGSMITEIWGLTAAHCFNRIPYHVWFKNFTELPVRLETAAEVLETFVHPSYRSLYGGNLLEENDIGLFHTSKIYVKQFARLSAIDYSAMLGLAATYAGGGGTQYNKTFEVKLEDDLRQLRVGEGEIVKCFPEVRQLSKYVMCLSPKCANRLQKLWHGDSGGPLIHDHKVIAVASVTLRSPRMSHAGFTPISPYLDWIYQVIHSKDNN